MTFISSYKSVLGSLTLSSDGENITGLWFDGQRFDRRTLPCEYTEVQLDELPVFEKTEKWLDVYFSGKEPDFMPPLKVYGSDFFVTVSNIMREIPFGKTMTYGEIALEASRMLGKRFMSSQAVGGAVGHNPISIIIPCHRVVGKNGKLTGYAGGLERKKFLLDLEKGIFIV